MTATTTPGFAFSWSNLRARDIALIGVVAIGVALRLAGLGASALWYDEAFTLALTRLPLLEMVRAAALDFNPPLWEIIAWVSTRLLGANEIGLRLPSFFASVAALLLVGLFVREHMPGLGGYAGLIVIALNPYQFWMAQDGRVYAVMSLLYLAGAWFAIRGRWLGLAAVLGLLLYSHMTSVFYAATLAALAVLNHWGKPQPVGAALLAALAGSPWLGASVHAMANDFWLGPFTWGGVLTALARIFFADALPPALWASAGLAIFGGVAGAVVIIVVKRGAVPSSLAMLAIVPLAMMLGVSGSKTIIFYRPLSALAIPMVLWLAATWPRWRWTWLKGVAASTWAVLLLAGLLSWSPASKGGDLRALADRMMLDYMRPGDVVYHATGTSLLPFAAYVRAPTYLLDEKQNDGLLSTEMQDALGIQRAALDDVPHVRAWIIWARDPVMSDAAKARMAKYVEGGTLIGTVRYWQAAPIQVWLVDNGRP